MPGDSGAGIIRYSSFSIGSARSVWLVVARSARFSHEAGRLLQWQLLSSAV